LLKSKVGASRNPEPTTPLLIPALIPLFFTHSVLKYFRA